MMFGFRSRGKLLTMPYPNPQEWNTVTLLQFGAGVMATVNILNLKPSEEHGERQFVVTVELRSRVLGRINLDLMVEADSIGRAPDVMRDALLALGHDLVDSFRQDDASA
ncbi:MAG TPA: hypothetical protein VK801_15690 [Caulobacteraceae bacterium]|jgi:hypothetical protein|nr:hypothetical protein [Caulobacteraceae bacterium]